MLKNENRFTFIILQKLKSKWMKDLTIKLDTLNLLEENVTYSFFGVGGGSFTFFSNFFIRYFPHWHFQCYPKSPPYHPPIPLPTHSHRNGNGNQKISDSILHCSDWWRLKNSSDSICWWGFRAKNLSSIAGVSDKLCNHFGNQFGIFSGNWE